MIGLDTSFLVALSIREHTAHNASLKLFNEEIRNRNGSMALTPQVLAEYSHVITDSRRFEHPLQMDEAIELCDQWWHSRECYQVSANSEAAAVFLSWMTEYRLGRKQILDTLLAASYYCAGVKKLATTNWRDFNRYGVFEILTLE